jgi:alkylhydroperoxidase/carboxymuconolactone decarboxylase family protein YurZ
MKERQYLPRPFLQFAKHHPEIAKAWEELGAACHEAGPLDAKTRHLVKLGVAMGLRSEGGVKTHTRRSLDAGASAAEVRQAVLLSLTTCGFPAMIAAMGWVSEVLDARGAKPAPRARTRTRKPAR